MGITKIHDLIYSLEVKLMTRQIEYLQELLADDFLEFGSSGRTYTKKDQVCNGATVIQQYEISNIMIK